MTVKDQLKRMFNLPPSPEAGLVSWFMGLESFWKIPVALLAINLAFFYAFAFLTFLVVASHYACKAISP